MTRLALAMLALVALSACASSSGSRSGMEPFSDTGADDTITIVVQNRNFADARLYALRPGGREILGTVTGLSDDEITLDWSFSEPLRIEIDLVAGPSCTTREIRVDPGDVLELQIASVFTESQACG